MKMSGKGGVALAGGYAANVDGRFAPVKSGLEEASHIHQLYTAGEVRQVTSLESQHPCLAPACPPLSQVVS